MNRTRGFVIGLTHRLRDLATLLLLRRKVSRPGRKAQLRGVD
jgi:hypothetical protein